MSLLDMFGGYRQVLRAVTPKKYQSIIRDDERSDDTPFPKDFMPQQAYMWHIVFSGVPSEDNSPETGKGLRFHAKSVNIPALQQEAVKRFYRGNEYAYAGKDVSPRVIRVSFVDNQNLDAYHYFQRWFLSSNDPYDKKSTRPEFYKRQIGMFLEKPNGIDVNEQFTFDGCFPTEISEIEFSYESSEVMQFDVMFHYEKRLSGVN